MHGIPFLFPAPQPTEPPCSASPYAVAQGRSPRKILAPAAGLILALGLSACGGGGGGATPSPTPTPTPTPTPSSLTLTLPALGLKAADLALIVAEGDALSEAVAADYAAARGVPAANIIKVKVNTGASTISDSNFALLKASIDSQLPAGIQATLLTWSAPTRVVGACSMGITSAMALGYDSKYCNTTPSQCASTQASPYYDSESRRPWDELKVRPAMMLGAKDRSSAQALIARGLKADGSLPAGDGYLIRSNDFFRNVRADDYSSLPGLWASNSGLKLIYTDNSSGGSSGNTISSKTGVLFYFTDLATVPNLATNSYLPGAIGDALTSFGGRLPDGNGQMPITAWLDAGLTASYGTVEEPCNFTQKFSRAATLMDHYYRGSTLIEAYWKSVEQPGQGLFIGEPLAQPFKSSNSLAIVNGEYVISTRELRPGARYSLEYLDSSGNWISLASFNTVRALPQTLRAPLAPSSAQQLRWRGPCPSNSSQTCTLASSS